MNPDALRVVRAIRILTFPLFVHQISAMGWIRERDVRGDEVVLAALICMLAILMIWLEAGHDVDHAWHFASGSSPMVRSEKWVQEVPDWLGDERGE